MHNSLAQKVLEATDIVEVVQEHVSLTRKGKEFVGLCPFHPDRKPSMNVSPKKQIFKCFACGAGGDALKFVQMRQRLDFRDALALLAQRAGISLATSEADRRGDRLREQIRQAIAWAASHFHRNLHETAGGKAALEYARRRGLTAESVERHKLGYAPDGWDDLLTAGRRVGLADEVLRDAGLIAVSERGKTYDRFRHRLMFPIADPLGRHVAFGGRALGDDSAKYLNSPETSLFSKSRILYGLDLARQSIEQNGAAIVVEGYLDVVLLHQFGFTHAVAALGTALTDAHVKLLKQRAEKLILCFDGDRAGVKAADRAVETSLLGGISVHVAVLEAGTDPADCVLASGASGLERALQSAADALEFKWSLAERSFGDPSPRTRRVAIEAFLEFVAAVTTGGGIDPLEQGLLVRRLGELLALPPDAVYPMLAAARRRSRPAQPSPTASPGEASSYGESIRGLPAGVVAAVEEMFGLLLSEPSCAEHLGDEFVQAVSLGDVWSRVFAVVQELKKERGECTLADVMARCDDAAMCELVSRGCARVTGTRDATEAFVDARDRLAEELRMQRMGELHDSLRGDGQDGDGGDQAFGRLLETARGRDFALAARTRWNAPSAS